MLKLGLIAAYASQEVELKQKTEDADQPIEKVGKETEKFSKEKVIADEEEVKVQVMAKDVSEKQRPCEEDLAKAELTCTENRSGSSQRVKQEQLNN